MFVAALLLALLVLKRRMARELSQRDHARYTLAATLVAAGCLFMGGPAYYLFLAAVLAWLETAALRLLRSSTG